MALLPKIAATGGDPPERMSSIADQTLFVAALVLLGVVFVLLFLLRKHNEMAKQLQIEVKKHWQIYELMNLYFFEYEYAADQLIVFEPAAEKGEPNQRKVYSQVSTNGQVPFAHLLADFLRRKQNGVHGFAFGWQKVCKKTGDLVVIDHKEKAGDDKEQRFDKERRHMSDDIGVSLEAFDETEEDKPMLDMEEEIDYRPVLLRIALPYGLAADFCRAAENNAMMDDFRAKYVTALWESQQAKSETIQDLY